MKWNKLGTAAGTVTAAVAISLFGTAPAFASVSFTTTDKHMGGRAYWESPGDRLRVLDQRRDGYSAWAGLYTSHGKFVGSVKASGKGKLASKRLNRKEGRKVIVKVCLVKGGGKKKYCAQRINYA
ncbi:hypothetical protein [Streptomyces halobius]|uniref:Uncharacterized protein n=1 Tax=Streptomyces halobius TaxID=2879846 RepID=A0ABY4M415_9ACTN|nr:hypothetical protein [Streptomyces halobius]UQA92511.1 hypothetical protein K9S39_12320 [Streptomyces halobius]